MVAPIGLHLESRFKNSSMCFIVQYHKYANITFRLTLRYQIRHQGAKPIQERLRSLRTSRDTCKSTLTSFNTKQTHSSFISVAWIVHRYHPWMPMINLTMWTAFFGSEGEEGGPPLQWATPRTPDGSGMDHMNPEDILILLPSTLGWR